MKSNDVIRAQKNPSVIGKKYIRVKAEQKQIYNNKQLNKICREV